MRLAISKPKLIIALVASIGIGLILIVAIEEQAHRPTISSEPPKGSEEKKILPSPSEWGVPTLSQGRYYNPELGYSLQIPTGWETAGVYPGVFRSPDEEGLVGYADTKGMVITVNKHPNDTQIPVSSWFSQEDLKRYLVGEPQPVVIAGHDAIQYEANWDTLGYAVGTLIAVDRQIFQIDCFHPHDSFQDKKKCQTTLGVVLQTLQFDTKR